MDQQLFSEKYNSSNRSLYKRYEITLDFVKKHLSQGTNILDLGIDNPFSKMLRDTGYQVENTNYNQDLDLEYTQVLDDKYEAVTAFEILEHLVAPFNVLREIKAPILIVSVPLDLWFAKAYWNEKDPWDRHYHEFEPRQFDMLLDKAGWEIVDSKKWANYDNKIGIRPILRRFFPRYYLVCCKRKKA